MESEREIFIHGLTDDDGNIIVEGCIRRGVDEKTAISVYDEMESFAHYAFNKSHAAAYANISYKTAWLKCHYPREYMAALLSSVLDNQNKLASYITECKRLESVCCRLMSTKAIFILRSAEMISVTDFLPLKISAEIS